MDHRRLWRDVSLLYDHLETVAPDGHAPVVEVFLAGREKTIVPAYVQTSRDPEHPWILLQARSARDEPSEKREPDEFWVYVHPSFVERVEIRFLAKGEKPIGFGHREVDEPNGEDR